MTHLDYPAISHACDLVQQRCSQIPIGMNHGSCWLYDQVMRAFSDPAVASVTYAVYVNCVGPGEATIGRDGSLVMRRAQEP